MGMLTMRSACGALGASALLLFALAAYAEPPSSTTTGKPAPAASDKSPAPENPDKPEQPVAAQTFLRRINAAAEEALKKMPGLTPEVVGHIMEHRKSGK